MGLVPGIEAQHRLDILSIGDGCGMRWSPRFGIHFRHYDIKSPFLGTNFTNVQFCGFNTHIRSSLIAMILYV